MPQFFNYLTFDGHCLEAMTFYKDCFSGELFSMPFGEEMGGAEHKDRTMHANIQINKSPILMASDSMPGHPVSKGNNFSVSVACQSKEECDKYFSYLVEGGAEMMKMQDTFWGAYFGMVVDKFGIQWMFNFDYPQA